VATAIRVVDIDDSPDLRRLVEELRASRTPIVLRLAGEAAGVVSAPEGGVNGQILGLTSYEREAFRSTSGGWAGYIDVDEFLEETYASRSLPPRPLVDLE